MGADHHHDHAHHGHGHNHHHHPPAAYDRAFALGVALNLGFVFVEAFYGWMADSLALLADAGHNLSDVAGLLLAWAASAAARLLPTHRRTYGWARASIWAALANGVLLLVAMGALGLEALRRLHTPEPVAGWTVIVVALAGVAVNGVTALLFLSGSKEDLNIRGAFLHMAGDALVSVGVALAGALYLLFGWSWLDPMASLAVALAIIIASWGLLREALHLSFDGVPQGIDLIELHDWLSGLPGVRDVHDLHVWALGTADTALSVHLVMPAGHPGDAFLRETAKTLEERFHIHHPTIQIELDGLQDGCSRPVALQALEPSRR